MYAPRLGFWQTYVMTVIYRYLDCGNLHMGFARVRCDDCGHEYLLAFSCKQRQFCPSCHQKRVVEYEEWLLFNVLKKEGTITDAVIEKMLSWRHSGFHVYIGDKISSNDQAGLGNLARYIIRTCFSQERMVYIPAEESDDGIAKVVYTSKD
ncbi:MAG: IS91 family transposase, partial [Desulfobacteraceae bacterium]|nr:IS91 family transposase [Desulfobacteraceae bacterium]